MTGNSRKDFKFENDKGVELRRSKSPKEYTNFKCLLPKESDKGKWSVKSLAWSRKEENNSSKKCINHSSSSMGVGLGLHWLQILKIFKQRNKTSK